VQRLFGPTTAFLCLALQSEVIDPDNLGGHLRCLLAKPIRILIGDAGAQRLV